MILNKPAQGHYDLVIIGSGPAGITTAMEVAKTTPARVAIVESGLLQFNERIHSLGRVKLSGDLQRDYFPMHTQRRFGGSSTIWGGFCATLEKRAFMAQEWPIEYAELAQWYPAAARILDLPSAAYRRPDVSLAGTSDIVYRPFYLSPPVRFNEKYRQVIEQHPNIHLILGKTCGRLISKRGSVAEAELLDSLQPHIEPASIKGDRFVVACGGVGNPRLLQLSGIATDTPVGLGLMEHPHLYGVAELYLHWRRVQQVIEKRARVVHALQLSNHCVLDNKVLSYSVDFNLQKAVVEPLLGRNQEMVLTPASIRAEMAPYPQNAVRLADEARPRDYLRQPMTELNFKFYCEEPANRCWQIFAQALLRSGLGRPSLLPPELKADGGGHLMGTTRMGRTPADSVVDSNCRVHATDNLYVAGSSVFPAGGASNPTYSIVAMALRLGNHLASTMRSA